MADFMDQPLDEKTLQALLVPLILHKFQAQQQEQDPMRQAQIEHMQTQTQQLKDANDPAKLIALLTGQGAGNTSGPTPTGQAFPEATQGATAFLPNGSFISSGNSQGGAPSYNPPTEYNLDSGSGAISRTSKGLSDPNQDTIIRSKNPATGNPWFGNQLPEWASPEARTAFNADRAGLPGTGETTPKANNDTTGKANSDNMATQRAMVAAQLKGKLPEKELEKLLDIRFPAPPDANAGVPGATGEAALVGVDPGLAALARKVSAYELPIAGFGGMDAKTRAKVLPLVAQMDPNFDATQYGARQALRKDFTSGKQAQNIRSLNTVIPHLDSLSRAADALDNSGSQIWNYIANKGIESGGDPRITAFKNAATAVENELATVFKGTSGTDQEIKQWRDNLSSSQSPEQLHAGINQAIDLLNGRMSAVQDIWEKGMGKPLEQPLLSSKSQAILDKIGGSAQPGNPASAAMEKVSRSGKPIISTDGGATWRYK